MINVERNFDILLFPLKEDVKLGDVLINKGWNQMRRKDKTYCLYHLDDITMSYASLPVEDGLKLAKIVFDDLLDA